MEETKQKQFVIGEDALNKLGSFLGKCPYAMKNEIDEIVKGFSDLKVVEFKESEVIEKAN